MRLALVRDTKYATLEFVEAFQLILEFLLDAERVEVDLVEG